MMTERRSRFQRLIVEACNMDTDWLIRNVRDHGSHATRLSVLACLRVIASRTYTGGLPYRERMKIVKAQVFS